MKSVKPGRGPSMMGGIAGIFVTLFGVFWTFLAVSMGFGFMAIFGILFICIAIAQTVYNFKNATGENRYSVFDITDSAEEPDPFNEYIKKESASKNPETAQDKAAGNSGSQSTAAPEASGGRRFCPYCQSPIEGDFKFCMSCGRELPDLKLHQK